MSDAAPTRVLLADDHHVVRHGLRLLVDSEPDLTVVAEAGDGIEAVRATLENDIDLAILDVSMPRMTGITAARQIIGARPDVRVLMLSMHDSEQFLYEALKAGASGYVLKSVADEDLVSAVRATMRGDAFVYPGAMGALARDYLDRLKRGERVPDPVLTAREDQVLKLVAEGRTSREIADTLTISLRTVERHRENILAKLGMRDRTQLTRYAIRAGLIEP